MDDILSCGICRGPGPEPYINPVFTEGRGGGPGKEAEEGQGVWERNQ